MAVFKQDICVEPVNKIINEIDNNISKNIILFGHPGTGKSVVLSEYMNRQVTEVPIINASLKHGEFIYQKDEQLYNLYHVCLIVNKMIEYIEKNHEESKVFFLLLKNTISRTLYMIDALYSTYKLESKNKLIDEKLLNNPEILLHSFFDIAFPLLGYKKIVLVIDDFDKVGDSSKVYQNYLYRLLKNYVDVNFVITASDPNIDKDRLSKEHKIIDVNYSFDINTIKQIFNLQYRREAFLTGIIPSEFFDDKTCGNLIDLTNGNLFDMNSALSYFYQSDVKTIYNMYYYIENILNKDPIISGNIKKDRKLHI